MNFDRIINMLMLMFTVICISVICASTFEIVNSQSFIASVTFSDVQSSTSTVENNQ